MKPKELEQIRNKIEWEGFDYALLYYSDWKDIKDKEFHRLREDYIVLRKRLSDYLDIEDA